MKIVFKCKTCGRIIVVESELHPIGSQKKCPYCESLQTVRYD